MMRLIILLFILFMVSVSSLSLAQPTHEIDFEPAGVGATWTWVVGENGDNPPLEIIANPVSGGINTSPTVAKFTARQSGNPWALFFTDDDGEFTFDASNAIVKIMVYKSVISPVHFKVEGAGGSPVELIDTNTVINQWEELIYDFSGAIGNSYNRLVIIPDFYSRPQDNIIYIDNIEVPDGQLNVLPEPTIPAPVPLPAANHVISVFSDVYPDIPANLNPNWGQSTTFSFVDISGDTVIRYGNLNYQGIEFGSSQNLAAAGMQFLHLDFWNANSTDLGVYLISPGPVETRYTLIPPDTTENWVSVDIPLSNFTPVDLSNVFQMKFDGNGTMYLDNIYFWDGIVPVELTMYSASVDKDDVHLIWNTSTETNNSGFQVERKTTGNYESISFIEGAGTTIEPVSYSFTDINLSPGTYYYRLKQIDYDGTFEYSEEIEVSVSLPDNYSLEQNYPNPFNPETTIDYNIPVVSKVVIKVYDILGNEISLLVNEEQQAGSYQINFDASNLPSGIYIYRLQTDEFISTRKMTLMK